MMQGYKQYIVKRMPFVIFNISKDIYLERDIFQGIWRLAV